MDSQLQNKLSWLKSLPTWAKVVVIVVVSAVAAVAAFTSCGVPRISVVTSEDGVSKVEANTSSSTTTTIIVDTTKKSDQ